MGTLCNIYIGSVAPNPKSISISQDGRTSIAKGNLSDNHLSDNYVDWSDLYVDLSVI